MKLTTFCAAAAMTVCAFVDTTSGAAVRYRVWSGNAPGGREGGATGLVTYDEAQAVALPESGVKYFTMEVVTTPR